MQKINLQLNICQITVTEHPSTVFINQFDERIKAIISHYTSYSENKKQKIITTNKTKPITCFTKHNHTFLQQTAEKKAPCRIHHTSFYNPKQKFKQHANVNHKRFL